MTNENIVDVDNPNFKSMDGPIDAHSKIASLYAFRPPYLKRYFQEVSKKLCLNEQDILLDLCCGRGEISIGFVDQVEKIIGVDGSSEMLKFAVQHPKIKYYDANINTDPMTFIPQVNCITMGSSVHWIQGKTISELVLNRLHKNGHILISHTLLKTDDQPYAKALQDVNRQFGKLPQSVDLWGKEKMKASQMVAKDGVRVVKKVSFDFEYLYRHQLSYAYGDFFRRIMENKEE